MTSVQQPYRVSAYNTAKQSENKMHDDVVARRFGFSGGLVPGVDVMAYMMHAPIAKWGRIFLERGRIEARFVKPVYDGEMADVFSEDDNGRLALRVESRGELCATGNASLPDATARIALNDYRETLPVAQRPPVDASSFALEQWLGTAPRAWNNKDFTEYLEEVRATDQIYRDAGALHPGIFQRIMNQVLVQNVILGPWIHVGSTMQLLTAAHPHDELVARARVTANYDKKGHRFVELDALVVANGTTPVAHCQHVAIYQPREQAAA
jgi:acyl dehydratase